MDESTHFVPLKLPNDKVIQVEVRGRAEREVSALPEEFKFLPDELSNTISGLAQLVDTAVQQIKPDKVNVEFAIEIGMATGKLTALLVNGSMKGNLKIGLEWKPRGQ